MVHRWVFGATLAVTAVIAFGCGGPVATATPTAPAVLGPWQARPFEPLDESLATAAESRCRSNTPEARGLPVVLHDQRGDGIDTVVFAAEAARASCQVAGDATGNVVWLASGATNGPAADGPGLDGIVIDGMGSTAGSAVQTVTDISGRAGPAIASLRILLDDGREVTATTSNGWFYAWWPGDALVVSLVGADTTGRPIASVAP